MDPKEVIFSPEAERKFKKLSRQNQKTVWSALKKLREGEDNLQIEKIKSAPAFFRVRAGDMRIVYYPLSRGRVVLLLIGNRKDVYRQLSQLNGKLSVAIRKLKIAK